MPAITLSEAQARSNNVLLDVVFENVISEGEFLNMIPFVEFEGTQLDYRRESVLPTANVSGPTGTRTSDNLSTSAASAVLKIVYQQFDLYDFFDITLSNVMNQRAVDFAAAVKAIGRTVHDLCIYGDEDNNADQWDGLHDFLQSNTGQRRERGAGGAGGVLRIQDLDEMIRRTKIKPISLILMSQTLRDNLKRYWDSLGSSYATVQQFGMNMLDYKGIPILGTDYIVDTEAVVGTSFDAKTGGATTSVFCVSFGERGLHGIAPSAMTSSMGWKMKPKDMPDNSGTRFLMEWYLNPIVVKSVLSVAGITGLLPNGTITA